MQSLVEYNMLFENTISKHTCIDEPCSGEISDIFSICMCTCMYVHVVFQ